MKTRRDTRKIGRSSPYFYYETEENTYTILDVEGTQSMKNLSKHF